MAWKRLRPSCFHTVCKSLYIGALISLLTVLFVGIIYMMVTYVSFKTVHVCQFYPMNSSSSSSRPIAPMRRTGPAHGFSTEACLVRRFAPHTRTATLLLSSLSLLCAARLFLAGLSFSSPQEPMSGL